MNASPVCIQGGQGKQTMEGSKPFCAGRGACSNTNAINKVHAAALVCTA